MKKLSSTKKAKNHVLLTLLLCFGLFFSQKGFSQTNYYPIIGATDLSNLNDWTTSSSGVGGNLATVFSGNIFNIVNNTGNSSANFTILNNWSALGATINIGDGIDSVVFTYPLVTSGHYIIGTLNNVMAKATLMIKVTGNPVNLDNYLSNFTMATANYSHSSTVWFYNTGNGGGGYPLPPSPGYGNLIMDSAEFLNPGPDLQLYVQGNITFRGVYDIYGIGSNTELSLNLTGAANQTITGNGLGLELKNFSDAAKTGGSVTIASTTTPISIRDSVIIGGPGNTTINSGFQITGFTGGGILPGTVTKNGTGTLTLNAANTYTTATTVNSGILDLQNSSALGTGAVSVASGASIQIDGSGLTIPNAVTINGTGFTLDPLGAINNLANTNTWSGLITLGSNATISSTVGTLNITNAGTITGSGFGLSIGGGIGGAGITAISSIIGTGGGTVNIKGSNVACILSGTNTYTGSTTIQGGGRLTISSDANLGTAPASATPGQLVIETNGLLLTTASFTLNANRGISLASGAANIYPGSGDLLSYSGIIAGPGNLTCGTGILALSGANLYSGGTSIESGTLDINNASAIGTGAFTIFPETAITLDNTSGNPITLSTNNTQNWEGSFTFGGSNALNLGTGTVTLSVASPVVTTTTNTLTVGGTINGSGFSLTKAGSGILAFGSSPLNPAVSLIGLTINAGTFTSTSGTLSLSGNFTNNATFNANSGTVTFINGGITENISGTSNTSFYKLTLNNPIGAYLSSSINVNATLTLSQGLFQLGNYNLNLTSGATASGGNSNSYVTEAGSGVMNETYSGPITYNFPIGDNSAYNYTPMSLTFTSGTNGGTISVLTNKSKESNITGSPYLNRYWTVSQSGLGSANYSFTGTYVPGDVVGTGSLSSALWSGSGPWALYSVAASNQVTGSGVTAFGDISGIPALPTVSITLANCSVNAITTGDVAPLSYSWNGGATTTSSSIAITTSGTYSVVVTDGNGNSSTTATISVTALSVTTSITANVLCNGNNTGSATVTTSGGTSPYTYSWSDGNLTSSMSNKSAGTYTVTITDLIGCTATATAAITQPASVGITISSVSNVSCNGGTGTVTANNATGGIGIPIITTIAGNHVLGYNGNGGLATSAELNNPKGVAVDGSGNVFIADFENYVVREVNHSTGIINNVAGNGTFGNSGNGGAATSAQLNPIDIAIDGSGNIFIADYSNSVIREVNYSTGYISTVAGNNTSGYSGDGGAATSAALANPTGVAVDGSGNIFIADVINNVIREVNHSTGNISTVAGNGSAGYSGDGGTATSAQLNDPFSIAVDLSNNIYIADVGNNVIRKVNLSTGYINTVAGNGAAGYTGNGGSATSAELNAPYGLAVDRLGNIYIGDVGNSVIREVNQSNGIISTVVGDNIAGYSGDAGAAISAELGTPEHLAVDGFGNIYSSEVFNNVIREVSSANSTLYNYSWTPAGGTSLTTTAVSAGTYTITATDANGCTGSAIAAITQPNALGIIISSVANVSCNGQTGTATANAANGGTSPYTYSWSGGGGNSLTATVSAGTYTITVKDNCGATANAIATITQPSAALFANNFSAIYNTCYGGNIGYLSVSPLGGTLPYTYSWSTGAVTSSITNLVAGTYTVTVTDVQGCTASAHASIGQPSALGITISASVSNVSCFGGLGTATANSPNGGTAPYTYSWSGGGGTNLTTTTLSAGTYTITVKDNCGAIANAIATITQPTSVGITISSVTNVSCNGGTGTATANNATGGTPLPIISTEAGNGARGYNGDNIAATTAELWAPQAVAVDGSGNIIITDGNVRIRKVNSSGIISTLAGTGTAGYNGDNIAATAAELNIPLGAIVDGSGNLYIDDYDNNRIRKVNTSGIITTIVGNGTAGYNGDGIAATAAELNHPVGVTLDGSGNLFIADFDNNRIREINTSGIITTYAGDGYGAPSLGGFSGDGGTATAAELYNPRWVAFDGAGNMYIADQSNDRIRKVNTSGIISTFAGNGTPGSSGDGGNAISAELNGPSGVALDGSGNLYIVDENNNKIRRVNTSGIISTVTGNETAGYFGDGGAATLAELNQPLVVAFDVSSNLYIADPGNNRIRKVSSAGSTLYNYSWTPSGGTSLTTTAVSAGTYTITATDANGCTGSAIATISQPGSLGISISSVTNVSCNGQTGSATANAGTGGTSPYTYSWSGGGGTNLTTVAVAGGTYTITVKDNNGCSNSAIATITQPASPLGISITSVNNVRCNGGTGTATAHVATGGTQPYTYSWSGGGGTSLATTALSAGTYTITVTDNHLCTATAIATITQPSSALGITISSVSTVSCNGDPAIATANAANGGTPPYTYSWGGAGGTNLTATFTLASSVSSGTYKINVTDLHGCTADAIITITQPWALSTNFTTVTKIFSYEKAVQNWTVPTGITQVTITAAGATGGNTTTDFGGNSNNLYYLGGNGANLTGICNVTPGDKISIVVGQAGATQAFGGGGGGGSFVYDSNSVSLLAVAAGGGGASYNFNIANNGDGGAGGTDIIANTTTNGNGGNGAGGTGGNGGAAGSQISFTDNGAGGAGWLSNGGNDQATGSGGKDRVNGFGGGTGTANGGYGGGGAGSAAGGGGGGYNGGGGGNNTSVYGSGGGGGSYLNGSVVGTPVANNDGNGFVFITYTYNSYTNVTCNGFSNGSASPSINGGTLPYTYSWSGVGGTDANTSNLSAGTYTLMVRDYHGCSSSSSVTISQPANSLSVSASETTTGLCYGDAATITTSVSGGTANYSYSWSDGTTNSTATVPVNTGSATYIVTVTDANGCTQSASIAVTEPTSALSVSASETTTGLCYGDAATITTSVSGGTPIASSTIYIIGGNNNSGVYATNYAYNSVTNTYATEAPLPTAESSGGTATVGNIIYYIGGSNAGGSLEYNTNYAYNTSTNTWATEAPIPTACVDGGVVAVGNIIYCIGGLSNGGSTVLATNYAYNTTNNTWTTLAPLPTVNYAFSAVAVGNIIYCISGYNGSGFVTSNYAYNTTTNTWTTEASIPAFTGGGCCGAGFTSPFSAAVGNIIYITGGYNDGLLNSTNFAYNTTTNTWTSEASIPIASFGGSGCSAGNVVYCIGGYNFSNYLANNTAYNTITNTWTTEAPLPVGLSGVSAVVGASNYSYSWSDGTTNSTATVPANTGSATYIVTVTDANGCSQSASIAVTEPAAALSVSASETTTGLCYGDAATITTSVSGGTANYSYSWSDGTTNSTATVPANTSSATYVVTVTDANGCSSSYSIAITEPTSALSVSASETTTGLCYGDAATITTSVSGGTANYSYSWSDGTTNSTATVPANTSSATYVVTVTDANGCSSSYSIAITEPTSALSVSASETTTGLCYGDAATITTSVSGGTANYSYSWSDGTTNSTATVPANTASATYIVNVTDANGCTQSASIAVTEPTAALSVSANETTTGLCYGDAATITTSVSGGTANYSYSWSDGTTNSTATVPANTSSATYVVTVTDANGCSSSYSIAITEPTSALSVSSSVTNVTCNGGNNGSSTLNANGGTSPYYYSWSDANNQTTATAAGLVAGTYTVTITDNNGCSVTSSVVVTQPNVLGASATNNNVTCNGFSNGSGSVSANGGTMPYTYSWSNGVTTNSISGLSAGSYNVTVQDNCGVSVNASITITQPASVGITISSVTNVLCNGGTGTIIANNATGGTPIPTNSIINLVAGNAETYGFYGYSGDGGNATAAELNTPEGVAIDGLGNIYFDDNGNARIRKINTSGIITTVAGNGTSGYNGDGIAATLAELNVPQSITVDASGNIYIADRLNQSIRKVNTSGIISTVAGNGTQGYNGDGIAATAAELAQPDGVAVDIAGNIYISDYYNYSVRKVSTSGIISTIAGNGTPGYNGDGIAATSAELGAPQGIAIDASGNLYIEDGNQRIRKVNTSGIISTIAGNGTASYNGDGIAALSAELNAPQGIAVDGSGNIYIADFLNSRLRKVNTSGIISTIAGTGIGGFNGEGIAATSAKLLNPWGVVVDVSGNVFLTDYNNDIIRKVSSANSILYDYSWSPGGGTNLTATNISAGTYTITATDGNGCTGTAIATITQPNAIVITTSSTNSSCRGTGSITASVSGGISPYSYSWSSNAASQTTATASGIFAGTYTVTVTDANGCMATASVVNTSTPAVTASVTSTNSTCNGSNNGGATVAASLGTSPYTYSWSNAATTSSISSLSAGTYTITVTDANECTATESVTITQPAALTITTGTSAVTCNGGATGKASATPSGGTSPYTYSWSSGRGTASSATGLSAGTYTVHVSSNTGCSATACVTITQPSVMSITASITNVTCYGGATGKATATVSGGTSPYIYSWAPSGGNGSTATGLSAGTYTVHVSGNTGCSASASITITQPTALSITTSTTAVTCYGGATGKATATISGSTSPYTYSWAPCVSSTSTASGLSAGTYTIHVTSHAGCTASATVTITQPSALGITTSVTAVTCNGGSTGVASAAVSGGTSPYTYSWSPGGRTTSTASGLSAGTYTVHVTSHTGCTATASVTITQPAAIKLTTRIITNESCNGGATGEASVTASGGTSPYTYSWSPCGRTTSTASGLSAGTYIIHVTSHAGCTETTTVIITQPAALRDSISSSSCLKSLITATVGMKGGTAPYTYSWSICGGTKATISGLLPGTYAISIHDNHGCSSTLTVKLTCDANTDSPVTDSANGSQGNCCPGGIVNLYPNPNNGQFTIAGVGKGMIIEVYDYRGRKINEVEANNETIQLNMSNESNGIYLIRIIDKDGHLVDEKKVVKVR